MSSTGPQKDDIQGFINFCKQLLAADKATLSLADCEKKIADFPFQRLLSSRQTFAEIVQAYSQIDKGTLSFDASDIKKAKATLYRNIHILDIEHRILTLFCNHLVENEPTSLLVLFMAAGSCLDLADAHSAFFKLGPEDKTSETDSTYIFSMQYRQKALQFQNHSFQTQEKAPLTDAQNLTFTWRATSNNLRVYAGLCQNAFWLQDKNYFTIHRDALLQEIEFIKKHRKSMACPELPMPQELDSLLDGYRLQISKYDEAWEKNKTKEPLQLVIMDLYKALTVLQAPTKPATSGSFLSGKEMLAHLGALKNVLSHQSIKVELVQQFESDLQKIIQISRQKADLNALLGAIVLLRMWQSLFNRNRDVAPSAYLKMMVQFLHSEIRNLYSTINTHFPGQYPTEYIEKITTDLETLQKACANDLSLTASLVAWIEESNGQQKSSRKANKGKDNKGASKKKVKSITGTMQPHQTVIDIVKKEEKIVEAEIAIKNTQEVSQEITLPAARSEAPVFLPEANQSSLEKSLVTLDLSPPPSEEQFSNITYKTDCKLQQEIPSDVLKIMSLFIDQKKQVYIYGGFVRDCLHNVGWHDIDLVSDCDEATLLKMFPEAIRNPLLGEMNVYSLGKNISITLVPKLDLLEFSKDAFLAADALFADHLGQVFDPLKVFKALQEAMRAQVQLPVPGKDLIGSFRQDPSRLFRTIKTVTHLHQTFHADIYDALIYTPDEIKTLPFGKFLYHFTELFLRGEGAKNLETLVTLGLIPHVILTMGANWQPHFNQNSMAYRYLHQKLAQIDGNHVANGLFKDRIYLFALFLLPAIEKRRREFYEEDNNLIYSLHECDYGIKEMLEIFFKLYKGSIAEPDKIAKINQFQSYCVSMWSDYLNFRYQLMTIPPQLPMVIREPHAVYKNVVPVERIFTPLYTNYAYVAQNGGAAPSNPGSPAQCPSPPYAPFGTKGGYR